MNRLNNFWDMTGLRVNLIKSNIHMTDINDSDRREILEITRFVMGHLPFHYLGIPLASRT